MASLLHTASPKFFEPDYPGGLLHTYAAGTTTNKATYSDPNERTDSQNANPVVLDSAGRATIYGSGLYSFVFKDSAGTTVWSQDNIRILALSNAALSFLSKTTLAQMRSELGLGAAALVGTTINTSGNAILWDTSGYYPVGNGSNITNLAWANVTGAPTTTWLGLPRSYLAGLTLSNNATAYQIDIAAGTCRDSTNAQNITLAAFSKKMTASSAWASGTGNNGLVSAAITASTWYHVYAILDDDNTNADILFSTSLTPTLPTGYDSTGTYRRIGSVKTNSTPDDFIDFIQIGDDYFWSTPVLDITDMDLDHTAEEELTLVSTPLGIRVKAYLNVQIFSPSTLADGCMVYLHENDVTDSAASSSAAPLSTAMLLATGSALTGYYASQKVDIWTDTSQKIAARSSIDSTDLLVAVLGYMDRRGRDD